jgi:general secretion pathway protein F
MPAFDYIALTDAGRKQRGIIEADSARSARALIRQRSLTPVEVMESKRKGEKNWGRLWLGTVSHGDLALLTRQLATLLRAGIPLENCLDVVARQSESQAVKRVILSVRSQVREGRTLADSLGEFPRIFSDLYRATIAAGERSGYLDRILEKLADYTESQQQFRQKIQLALVYPILLVAMSVLIVTGLMVYVVPQILDVVVNSGQQLPTPTRVLVAVSDLLSGHGHWLMLGLALVVSGAGYCLKKPRVRFAWHKALLNAWFVKRFARGGNAARYTSTLAILSQSGIPLSEAMPIASAVCSNLCFREATREAQQRVVEGSSLNNALAASGFFPPMIIQLIASGEQTGDLAGMLERAAGAQETYLQQRVATLVSLFEPLTLLFMGALVMAIVLAVLLPILNLNQLVGA